MALISHTSEVLTHYYRLYKIIKYVDANIMEFIGSKVEMRHSMAHMHTQTDRDTQHTLLPIISLVFITVSSSILFQIMGKSKRILTSKSLINTPGKSLKERQNTTAIYITIVRQIKQSPLRQSTQDKHLAIINRLTAIKSSHILKKLFLL